MFSGVIVMVWKRFYRSKAILHAKVTYLEKSLPLGLCYKLPASLSVSFGFFVFSCL